jgi:hypothetical protein
MKNRMAPTKALDIRLFGRPLMQINAIRRRSEIKSENIMDGSLLKIGIFGFAGLGYVAYRRKNHLTLSAAWFRQVAAAQLDHRRIKNEYYIESFGRSHSVLYWSDLWRLASEGGGRSLQRRGNG